MSIQNVELPVGTLVNRDQLAEQSSTIAASLYDAVATAYLQFRRTYYHEEQPVSPQRHLLTPRFIKLTSRCWPRTRSGSCPKR